MDDKSRRDFLRGGWKLGGALLIGAAAYTGYEALRPLASGAGGAKITVGTDRRASPTDTSTYVPAGRMYVVNANDYLFALSQKCPHLGCHVPYCESSGRFECPCHGSIYDLAGEYIAGPAPRGMDRYEVTLDGDNVVVDTGVLKPGPPAAPRTSSRRPRARAASARPDVPRERPQPPPFEPEWLERSLNRYLAWGLVFMVLLLVGFVAYRVREPGLRRTRDARADRRATPTSGARSSRANCAQCHGNERDRRRERADAELEPVPEEHDRRPDLRARVGRRLGNRDAGVEPRLRRHVHRRAGPPGHHVPALARTERAERARLAPGRESDRDSVTTSWRHAGRPRSCADAVCASSGRPTAGTRWRWSSPSRSECGPARSR